MLIVNIVSAQLNANGCKQAQAKACILFLVVRSLWLQSADHSRLIPTLTSYCDRVTPLQSTNQRLASLIYAQPTSDIGIGILWFQN